MPLRLGAGIFVDNAMTLIPRPPWAPEQYVDFFNTAVEEALKFGLTSIHDASTDPDAVAFFKGFVILGLLNSKFQLFSRVAQAGKLPASTWVIFCPLAHS
jgi:predicted amidohydrolase YtcJ